jgi:predicted nucleic acid-binding protein
MKPRVYIETTIPSFYFEDRASPDMVARRLWTRHWWSKVSPAYDLVTSSAVIEELSRGAYPSKSQALALLDSLPRLEVEAAVIEIVQVYIEHSVMPQDPLGDALHLALASYNHCDFLLTWNCQHLANANKFDHIYRVNTLLHLTVPKLVTPLELGGEADVY